MRMVLAKPAYHTWMLHFHGVSEDAQWTIHLALVELERQLADEPRPVQPDRIRPGDPPVGRRCGLFGQIPYNRREQFVGWEYLGADSEDTVLRHAELVAARLGVELEL